ncbi:hypothetical protein SAMN04488038_106155 [Solimonas aquatica]|uniref:Uncharacterized protein n=1 Tax=Solimonas aquatica TaxID=489703 RepID=A0A1H9G050_9GAMM|nr:hypothetical protein [Solimonas aquatica]SEQ43108.1 hypothetical protein SAMN04488038_106155 [Solimonas aquatica]
MSFPLQGRELIPRHSVIAGSRCDGLGSGAPHAHVHPASGEISTGLRHVLIDAAQKFRRCGGWADQLQGAK